MIDDAPSPEEEAERMAQEAAERAGQDHGPKKELVTTLEVVITKMVTAEGVQYRATTQESSFVGTGETPQRAVEDYGRKAHHRRDDA